MCEAGHTRYCRVDPSEWFNHPAKRGASIGPAICETMKLLPEATKTEGTREGFKWASCFHLTVVESFNGIAIFKPVWRWCKVQRWIVRFRFWHWACKSSSQINPTAPSCRHRTGRRTLVALAKLFRKEWHSLPELQ